jgi:hypothetical protein
MESGNKLVEWLNAWKFRHVSHMIGFPKEWFLYPNVVKIFRKQTLTHLNQCNSN